jgi:hypothetical protein
MKLFVRVSAAKKAESHRRCGLHFTHEGAEFDVDEATAKRLCADQYLDVAEMPDETGLEEADLAATPAASSFEEAVAQADEAPAPAPEPAPAKAKAKAKK